MQRVKSTPRLDWRAKVESQGLVYPVTPQEDGSEKPYWYEDYYYALSLEEVERLEAATEELHEMCVKAAGELVKGRWGDLGLPPTFLKKARESYAAKMPSLYGRFDLATNQDCSEIKLIEYNADTPTGLVEAAIAQWYWLQDLHPQVDQWNSLHERLIHAWSSLKPHLAGQPVYFAHHEEEESGEEWMTVSYLRDTAEQAGLATREIFIGAIGYAHEERQFCDGNTREIIRNIFKLYPTEYMALEEFGDYMEAQPRGDRGTLWLEPLWKVVLSNKTLLPALWELYPHHPLLLPAYQSKDPFISADKGYVEKPLFGREGDGVSIHAAGVHVDTPYEGEEPFVYQEYYPLADFAGNKVILGSWVVEGKAAGLGIRESTGHVTNYDARFVPHLIAGTMTPSEEVREEWLQEDFQEAPLFGVFKGFNKGSQEAPPMVPLGGPTSAPLQDAPRGSLAGPRPIPLGPDGHLDPQQDRPRF